MERKEIAKRIWRNPEIRAKMTAAIKVAMNARKVQITYSDVAYIMEARAAGKQVKEIAKTLGWHQNTLYNRKEDIARMVQAIEQNANLQNTPSPTPLKVRSRRRHRAPRKRSNLERRLSEGRWTREALWP